MDHPETYFETIFIVFISNLHNTEALRLLESVQPILQPAEMLVSYTATLLNFCSVAFSYPWDNVWHLPNLSAAPSPTHLLCWLHHSSPMYHPVVHTITHPFMLLATPLPMHLPCQLHHNSPIYHMVDHTILLPPMLAAPSPIHTTKSFKNYY